MNGRILVGDHDGVYVLRFEGDVRVTLSASFEHYLESILKQPGLISVLVDLSDAIAIDSTSLGVLARLSIAVQRERGKVPTLVCSAPDILRILENMGFEDIFAIVNNAYEASPALAELPNSHDFSEVELRDKVIEAHRVLMSMNDTNHTTFKNLVEALEREAQVAQQTDQTGTNPDKNTAKLLRK